MFKSYVIGLVKAGHGAQYALRAFRPIDARRKDMKLHLACTLTFYQSKLCRLLPHGFLANKNGTP